MRRPRRGPAKPGKGSMPVDRTVLWSRGLMVGLALVLRDLVLPALWVDAWLSDDFVWRGNAMNLHACASEESSESAGQ